MHDDEPPDVNCRVMLLGGGRLFPGVYDHARFQLSETENRLSMDVTSGNGKADVRFSARVSGEWRHTPSFGSFDEMSEFFRKGDCDLSVRCGTMNWKDLQLKAQVGDGAYGSWFPPLRILFRLTALPRRVHRVRLRTTHARRSSRVASTHGNTRAST